MKSNNCICANRETYTTPDITLVEVLLEHGFADSIEIVGKDEEVEAF